MRHAKGYLRPLRGVRLPSLLSESHSSLYNKSDSRMYNAHLHIRQHTAMCFLNILQEMWGFAGYTVGNPPTASSSATKTHRWPSKSSGASSSSSCCSCLASSYVGEKTTKYTCTQNLLRLDGVRTWVGEMCIAEFISLFSKSLASLQEGALLLFFSPQEGWWVPTNCTSLLAFLG